jgi:O-antigen/teichoic acid export membrane protein
MLLTATVGLGAVLNVGTGAATIKQISSSLGRTAGRDVEHAVRSSLAIAVAGGGLLATLIFAAFWFTGDALFQKMGDQSLVRLTGAVAALLCWIEQIDNVFASALKGGEQFGPAARIEIGSKTVQIFGAVCAVLIWESLEALYVSLVLSTMVRLLAKSWASRRTLALTSFQPDFTNLTDILQYAKWGWLQGAGGLLFGIADRMLVGSFLGAPSLAHYSVATQLAQQIHALSAAGLSVIFPNVSRKLAQDADFSLKRIAVLTVAGNVITSGILALGLLIFGRTILKLWLGEAEAEATAELLWYLTIAYWFLAINVAPHFILLAVGRMRFVAMSNLTAGLVSLATMFALAQSYGLTGIALARIVYGMIILVNCLPLIECIWRRRGEAFGKTGQEPAVEGI